MKEEKKNSKKNNRDSKHGLNKQPNSSTVPSTILYLYQNK